MEKTHKVPVSREFRLTVIGIFAITSFVASGLMGIWLCDGGLQEPEILLWPAVFLLEDVPLMHALPFPLYRFLGWTVIILAPVAAVFLGGAITRCLLNRITKPKIVKETAANTQMHTKSDFNVGY